METKVLQPITGPTRVIDVPSHTEMTVIEVIDSASHIPECLSTAISIGEESVVRYIYLLDSSITENMVENRIIEVGKGAKLDSYYCYLGGAENKISIAHRVREDASLTHSVLFLTNDTQKFDIIETDELVDTQARAHTDIKGLLSQSSFVNYQATIKVNKDAQKTDGKLTMQSYILGKNAQSNMIPGLEVLADDVKASHSASVAHIGDEQLFYMQSRGLSEKQSIQLFIEGFIHTFVEKLQNEELKDSILTQAEKKYCI